MAVDIARAQIALGRGEEAVATAHEAAAFWERFAAERPEAGIAMLWEARALAAAGRTPEATTLLRQAAGTFRTEGHSCGPSSSRADAPRDSCAIHSGPIEQAHAG